MGQDIHEKNDAHDADETNFVNCGYAAASTKIM